MLKICVKKLLNITDQIVGVALFETSHLTQQLNNSRVLLAINLGT